MTKFLKDWFTVHNAVGDLETSGLEPRRVISLVINYDPVSIPVNKLIPK